MLHSTPSPLLTPLSTHPTHKHSFLSSSFKNNTWRTVRVCLFLLLLGR